MYNVDNQSFFIASGVLILTVLVPILITLFVITYHDRVAPRLNLTEMDVDGLNIHFSIKGHDYIYPVEDISRTGLAFSIPELPKSLIIENQLPLKVFLGQEGEISFDLTAKLIYMRTDDSLNHTRVGVKFITPLDNQTLFNIIERRKLSYEMGILNQQAPVTKTYDNVTDLERERLARALDQSLIAEQHSLEDDEVELVQEITAENRLHG